MDRQEKREVVEGFRRLSAEYTCVLVARQSGMIAGDSASLRKQLHDAGCVMRVVKNTLVKKALKDDPLFVDFARELHGPTALFFSREPSKLAKILVDFSQKKKVGFEIVSGLLENDLLNGRDVVELSKMPSIEQLRSRFVGILQAPITKLLSIMQAPAQKAVGVMETCAKEKV